MPKKSSVTVLNTEKKSYWIDGTEMPNQDTLDDADWWEALPCQQKGGVCMEYPKDYRSYADRFYVLGDANRWHPIFLMHLCCDKEYGAKQMVTMDGDWIIAFKDCSMMRLSQGAITTALGCKHSLSGNVKDAEAYLQQVEKSDYQDWL